LETFSKEKKGKLGDFQQDTILCTTRKAQISEVISKKYSIFPIMIGNQQKNQKSESHFYF